MANRLVSKWKNLNAEVIRLIIFFVGSFFNPYCLKSATRAKKHTKTVSGYAGIFDEGKGALFTDRETFLQRNFLKRC